MGRSLQDKLRVNREYGKKKVIDASVKDIKRMNAEYGKGNAIKSINFRSAYPKPSPVPMLLTCPSCGARHTDEGEFMTKPHHTHACQECGMVWRPAVIDTVGVWFLPGFKNE